ncbi:hypothetical protein M945_1231 [Clostridium saccharobutylicum DSM 13864]|nr:hypothetical protein M945_1231 [Clostridium saccharobutylicum DSM 13864]
MLSVSKREKYESCFDLLFSFIYLKFIIQEYSKYYKIMHNAQFIIQNL